MFFVEEGAIRCHDGAPLFKENNHGSNLSFRSRLR